MRVEDIDFKLALRKGIVAIVQDGPCDLSKRLMYYRAEVGGTRRAQGRQKTGMKIGSNVVFRGCDSRPRDMAGLIQMSNRKRYDCRDETRASRPDVAVLPRCRAAVLPYTLPLASFHNKRCPIFTYFHISVDGRYTHNGYLDRMHSLST